jgi:hypothetical protein
VNLENQSENAAAPASAAVTTAAPAASATSVPLPTPPAAATPRSPTKVVEQVLQSEPEPAPAAPAQRPASPIKSAPHSRQPSMPVVVDSSSVPSPTPSPVPVPVPAPAAGVQNGAGSAEDDSVVKDKLESLDAENEDLRKQVAERDTLIRKLELQVEQVPTSFSIAFFVSGCLIDVSCVCVCVQLRAAQKKAADLLAGP